MGEAVETMFAPVAQRLRPVNLSPSVRARIVRRVDDQPVPA